MSISAVSSSGSTYVTSDISEAERQKASILQQIQQEKSSSDDSKTKVAKIAKLELQLQQIQSREVSNQKIQASQAAPSESAADKKQDLSDNILHEYA